MAKTLFELEERLADMNAQISQEADALVQMASDAGAKMEDIRAKKTRVEALKERAALLENEVAQMKQSAKEKLNGGAGAVMSKQEAAGLFYKAALEGDISALPKMAYEQLGAKPAGNADQGAGSKLLPTTLANELLLEPQVTEPPAGAHDGDEQSRA